MELQKRRLGKTGLYVTVLGFGAMELRGPGSAIRNGRPIEPAQAEKVLNSALDNGINFVDTSIDYGSSEELIGEYIAHRRSEYYLASKCGCNADTIAVEAVSRSGDIRYNSALWDGTTRLPRILSIGHAIRAAVSKTSPAAMLGRRLAALSGVASESSLCPREATFIPKRTDEGACSRASATR